MPTTVTLTFDERTIAKILKSVPVARDMEARARRIAEAAGGAPDFVVVTGVTDRAHASAVTGNAAGRRAEAEDRVLSRAIDAGR